MEFINHTGHVFSIPSYSNNPIGYEYDEQPYIFWINESNKLSVNNYYIKPIRVLFNNDELSNIVNLEERYELKITINSKYFGLIGSLTIQNALKDKTNIFESISLDYTEFCKQELTEDDNIVIRNLKSDNNEKYSMLTFYVCVTSDTADVWLSNILIHLYDKIDNISIYCPITVGAEFVEENEALYINGKNMGIDLPKDIIRAVYGSNFISDKCDENLYNSKIKEYLLNYMNIKGECGNFKSAINSLNWFGWGDNITITKLLQTDNEFVDQYILDFFDIKNDVIYSYKKFRNSTYIKLNIAGTKESDKYNDINFENEVWGEGKPKIIDLLSSVKECKYDEGDITFYKPYYDYLFDELGLKLSALTYYYKKYFLPIHLAIHSASISTQVFANDNKFIVGVNKQLISERPQLLEETNEHITVTFPKQDYQLIYSQQHIIDENYNEFNDYILNKEFVSSELFWVDENCISIPIQFNKTDNNGNEITEQLFDCIFVFEKVIESIFKYEYTVDENIEITYKDICNLILITNNERVSINNYKVSHKLYAQDVTNKKLIPTDIWSVYMSLDELKKYINKQYISILDSSNDLPNDFKIKIKTKKALNNLYLGKNDVIKKSYCNILDDEHINIIEKHFSFVQKLNINSVLNPTLYRNFVIVPKILGKDNNINYWLNNEYNLNINVNGQWFTYHFTLKMPELKIELGKLQYKYYLDTTQEFLNNNGDISLFNQVNKIEDNKVLFNTFMWQPDLVKTNNCDYFSDLLKYYKHTKYDIEVKDEEIKYEGNEIKLNEFYYVLTLNDQKFYIHYNVIEKLIKEYYVGKYFKIPTSILSDKNKKSDMLIFYNENNDSIEFCAIYGEHELLNEEIFNGSSGSQNIKEQSEKILIMNEDGKNILFNTVNAINVDVNIYNSDEEDNCIIIYENEYDNTASLDTYIKIYFEIDKTNYKFYITSLNNTKTYLQVVKGIYKNAEVMLSNYKDIINTVKLNKYQNIVHLYDLYDENGNDIMYGEQPVGINMKYYNENNQYILYSHFFKNNGKNKIVIPDINYDFDFYLMHDDKKWYCLFISKLTKNTYVKDNIELNDYQKKFKYTDYIKLPKPTNIPEETISKYMFSMNNTMYNIYCMNNKYYVKFTDNIIEEVTINSKYENADLSNCSYDEQTETYSYNGKTVFISESNLTYYTYISNIELYSKYIETSTTVSPTWIPVSETTTICPTSNVPTVDPSASPTEQPVKICNLYNVNNKKYYNIDYKGDEYTDAYIVCPTGEPQTEEDSLYWLIETNKITQATTKTVLVYINSAYNTKQLKWFYKLYGDEYEFNKTVSFNYQDNTFVTSEPIYVELIKNTNSDEYETVEFNLKHIKTEDRFLLNRMEYISSDGINHFNSNDIIVATLVNNDRLNYKLDAGSKWNFEPMSLNMLKTANVDSKTEMAIISIGDSNIKYENGYYNINCNYSLDTNTTNTFTKKSRILIK